jgi:hypothetical protein
MRRHVIETWGVRIGWCVWACDGWLVFDGAGKFIEWTWHYTNIRELLETYWTDKAAARRASKLRPELGSK